MVDVRNREAARVEPDLASRQAAIAAVGWLVIAVGLGLAAQARLLFPDVLPGLGPLSYGRLRGVADTAFVFGWLASVGFCALFAVVPRCVGAQLHNEVLGATTVIAWNVAVLAGLTAVWLGLNQGRPGAEMPLAVDLLVLLLGLLVFYNVAMTSVRRNERRLYVSVWYLLASALVLPVVYALGNLTLFSGMRDALVGAFYQGALEMLWLVPVGLGIAYYVVPAATGNAVPSALLARIGFWTLAFAGGWTGVRYLVGGPIPEWLEAIGVGMTFVVAVPVLTAVTNLLGTLRDRWDAVSYLPVRFATVGLVALVVWVGLVAVSSIPSVSRIVGLTLWHAGLRHLFWFGVVSSFGFALLTYVYPLLVGRSWYSQRAGSFHFWTTVGGTVTGASVLMAAGLVQGTNLLMASRAQDPALVAVAVTNVDVVLRSFHWVVAAAWSVLALAQVVLAYNAARTARSGRPLALYAPVPAPEVISA